MSKTTLGSTGNIYRQKGREGFVIRWTDMNGRRVSRLVKVASIKAARSVLAAEKHRVEEQMKFGRLLPTEDTFARFAAEFLSYQEHRLSSRVVRGKLSHAEFARQKGIVNGHLVPYFGKMKLATIRRKDVASYINSRMGEAGDGTIIKEVNTLKRMFNVAIEQEKIDSNPANKAPVPKAPEGRVRYLSPVELGRVLNACVRRNADTKLPLPEEEQWLRNFVGLSVALGTRRGELLRARWEDLTPARRELRLRHTKNGKERPAFVNAEALIVLSAMSDGKLKGRGLLFPDVTPAQVTVAFIRACKEAGVTDFSLHDLRHTYASHARMSGVDLHTLQKLLGHSDPRMTDRYAHLSQEHLLEAATKLDGMLSQARSLALTVGNEQVATGV